MNSLNWVLIPLVKVVFSCKNYQLIAARQFPFMKNLNLENPTLLNLKLIKHKLSFHLWRIKSCKLMRGQKVKVRPPNIHTEYEFLIWSYTGSSTVSHPVFFFGFLNNNWTAYGIFFLSRYALCFSEGIVT